MELVKCHGHLVKGAQVEVAYPKGNLPRPMDVLNRYVLHGVTVNLDGHSFRIIGIHTVYGWFARVGTAWEFDTNRRRLIRNIRLKWGKGA